MTDREGSALHQFELPNALPWRARLELVWLKFLTPFRRRRWNIDPATRPRKFTSTEVLERLAALPVSLWTYDFEPGVRHLGPMSQDFAAMFGLGQTNRMINMVDANGVNLVAIKALYRRVQLLEEEVTRLRGALDERDGAP